MEAYLAARLGDSIGAHESIWSSIWKVAAAVGAGIAAAALVVAVCNPVGLLATAAVAAIAIGTGAGVTAITAKMIKRHTQETPSEGEGLHPHLDGSPCSAVLGVCSPNTFIENKMAARATIDMGSHGSEQVIQQGSKTVLVNGMPLARENDKVMCGGKIIHGCDRTWIGGPPSAQVQSTSDNAMDFLTSAGGEVAKWSFRAAAALTGPVGLAVYLGIEKVSGAVMPYVHQGIANVAGEDAADLVDMGLTIGGGMLGARATVKALNEPVPTGPGGGGNTEPSLVNQVTEGNTEAGAGAKVGETPEVTERANTGGDEGAPTRQGQTPEVTEVPPEGEPTAQARDPAGEPAGGGGEPAGGGGAKPPPVADECPTCVTKPGETVADVPPDVPEAIRTGEAIDTPADVTADPPATTPKYSVLKEMSDHYRGEDQPGNSIWRGSQVEYLRGAAKEPYRLHFQDGRVFDAEGNPFDTSDAATAHSGNGAAIYVMDESGNFYASKVQTVGEFHHSSLAAGEPVAAAGELVVKDGYIQEITRKSGHYRPSAEMQDQAVQELGDRGVDTSKIKTSTGF